jgi:hypothetical protein
VTEGGVELRDQVPRLLPKLLTPVLQFTFPLLPASETRALAG